MTRGLLLLAGLLVACSDGQKNLAGAEEPFRVRNAQFFEGALPGTDPPPAGTPVDPDGPPRVIGFNINASLIVTQGQGGKKLPGFLTTNAWSVGLALKNLGTGWWLVPAGDVDTTTTPPSLTFSAVADFGEDIPTGPTSVVAVALDDQGVGGPQFAQPLCIASSGPEGAAACPGGSLPAAAITLSWDTNVDLDLQVLTPDGKLVTPKHPFVNDDEGDLTKPHIDRDSNPNCVLDGARRESLIWPTVAPGQGTTEAPSGLYGVYVNLYSACGQQAVHFRVQISVAASADSGGAGAGGDDADTVENVVFDRSGEMVAIQTNASDDAGLFVTQYDFE